MTIFPEPCPCAGRPAPVSEHGAADPLGVEAAQLLRGEGDLAWAGQGGQEQEGRAGSGHHPGRLPPLAASHQNLSLDRNDPISTHPTPQPLHSWPKTPITAKTVEEKDLFSHGVTLLVL